MPQFSSSSSLARQTYELIDFESVFGHASEQKRELFGEPVRRPPKAARRCRFEREGLTLTGPCWADLAARKRTLTGTSDFDPMPPFRHRFSLPKPDLRHNQRS
jgi:hypothetical protein